MEKHKWTNAQKEYIFKNYKGIGNTELTARFNECFNLSLPVEKIKGFKKNNNLNSGVTGRFEKGHIPANKGTKGVYNTGGNVTSFKKGSVPKNTDPIGTEKRLSDGYTYVKIDNQSKAKKHVNWAKKHYLIWETNTGQKVPDGHVVIFLDGNRNNFDFDNLMLIHRRELLVMNRRGLIKDAAELTKVGITLARMIISIEKKKSK
ncbi:MULTISPECIES: HNH endonuclease signature motif containing protein [unclassified Breznakia]|uniref:HNH endonuclease signature motif containing protein n=1 Tax=unclassified Breznakia TaxID=2623764 RepID=UPI002473B29A|nr:MULTISPECIES: HNH endonuclease signature motif containing protein [unclassified Breznakia]MDH6367533.1 hypothetical protein [Breznakia sp. PH1-1]MDH6404673.1 hypothetical protein [Breznakia sp. PF1-11]MDH6412363.1 hypothetical protein [Breznakia sp. PFB1-11]MDH6414701.1 hypothetical protein [Breznakia sp. PFB1-14]MDH6417054.1 hypothetical protein [Breznakia sp. PFB1-4]